MFVQLSGARSFTQQQWTVSKWEGGPHIKSLLYNERLALWMGRARTVSFYTNDIESSAKPCRNIKLPPKEHQKHMKSPAFYQESTNYNMLPCTGILRPSLPSQESAIKSMQVRHATEIKARIQMAPVHFPFLLSSHQFCSLLQKHLPCCPT